VALKLFWIEYGGNPFLSLAAGRRSKPFDADLANWKPPCLARRRPPNCQRAARHEEKLPKALKVLRELLCPQQTGNDSIAHREEVWTEVAPRR